MHNNLGDTCRKRGAPERAIPYLDRSMVIARELDKGHGIAALFANLTQVRHDLGELATAALMAAEGVERLREICSKRNLAGGLTVLGETRRASGELAVALAMFHEGLLPNKELGDQPEIDLTLEAIAGVAIDRGDAESAARLFAAAESLQQKMDVERVPTDDARLQRDVTATRAALGDIAARPTVSPASFKASAMLVSPPREPSSTGSPAFQTTGNADRGESALPE